MLHVVIFLNFFCEGYLLRLYVCAILFIDAEKMKDKTITCLYPKG